MCVAHSEAAAGALRLAAGLCSRLAQWNGSRVTTDGSFYCLRYAAADLAVNEWGTLRHLTER